VAQYLANLDVHQNFHTPISLEATQELTITSLNQIILTYKVIDMTETNGHIYGDQQNTLPANSIPSTLHQL
jgi:hypothetical protein